jgi:Icc-related predicted phosphoesterase
MYATDVHGSERTFRKFINSAKFYGADVLILGGDLTGKSVVPIVKISDNLYQSQLFDETVLRKAHELESFEEDIKVLGLYPYHVEKDNVKILEDDSSASDIFLSLAMERLSSWIQLADARLRDTGVKCYVTGGNDDPPEVESLLRSSESESLIGCGGGVVKIDEYHEMISLGYSNPTPWKTPRECSEQELRDRIETLTSQVENMGNCIFNFHCPPKDSGLDVVPRLDTSVYPPKPIPTETMSAGSEAVREAIEKHQPLLGLHGHIHESKGSTEIGRTLCINPGSEYNEAILLGTLIGVTQEQRSRVLRYQSVSG